MWQLHCFNIQYIKFILTLLLKILLHFCVLATTLLGIYGNWFCFTTDKVTKSGDNLQIIPNFTLKDSQDQTVFGLALWQVSSTRYVPSLLHVA